MCNTAAKAGVAEQEKSAAIIADIAFVAVV
jgi:hypothetical protein